MCAIKGHLHNTLPPAAVFRNRNPNRAEFIDAPEKQHLRAVLLQLSAIAQRKQGRALGIVDTTVKLCRRNDGDLQLGSKVF